MLSACAVSNEPKFSSVRWHIKLPKNKDVYITDVQFKKNLKVYYYLTPQGACYGKYLDRGRVYEDKEGLNFKCKYDKSVEIATIYALK